MPIMELALAQLTDPFRIGLIVALFLTARRTQSQTGTWLPLAAGLLFVAVIIPSTLPGPAGEPMWRLVAVGLAVNALILACVMTAAAAIRRLRA